MGFHQAVTEAAHNTVLSAVMAPLAALLRQVLLATPAGRGRGPATDDLAARNVAAHQRIYEAIAAGDGAGARRATVEHLALFKSRWEKLQESLSEVIARATRSVGRP